MPLTAPGSLKPEGSQIYAQECAVCHGANLQGT
jgi:mono/diheme cytochrome c family protein